MTDSSKIVLTAADGARAEVYRHGAHVTSWIPAGGSEQLFLSERSSFDAGSAIRGGIPVIFPQFASRGPLPKHGFARTREWSLVERDEAAARFQLVSNAETMAIWPHPFVADLSVRVGGNSLEVELAVRNTGADPLSFAAALHTYLAVNDVAQTRVFGLTDDALKIDGEVDRVFTNVSRALIVDDGMRKTEAGMRGFTDVVVWNPGMQKAAALADMAPGAFRRMLCVEAAIVETPVVLAPGATWSGAQQLTSH
jgi:glucose-6-phosphate 1-epimerase